MGAKFDKKANALTFPVYFGKNTLVFYKGAELKAVEYGEGINNPKYIITTSFDLPMKVKPSNTALTIYCNVSVLNSNSPSKEPFKSGECIFFLEPKDQKQVIKFYKDELKKSAKM
ncbi:MAG: hypothetical protein FWE53_05260 [Firmicutes bacterium]|nr:hypothetical protein [Bacillota bacterium]